MVDGSLDRVALNADVAGYSRLVADDVDATAAAMDEVHGLVAEQVAAAGGTVANFVGDNFMAVFDDATSALSTSIALTTELERRNADLPERRRLRFRMGLDVGPVSVSEGRFHGDALNVAARIQALARPGGVSVSGRVYRALDEPALRFRPLGERTLKNIPESVGVYELVDLPSDGEPISNTGLRLEAPTIAVLPIHTEHVEASSASAAGIIRGDLLHRLSGIPDLVVLDAALEGMTPREAARYMLETGVHQFGDTLRVFATLFDVTTMNVVKSHKWTVAVADLLDLSDGIADEVARSVEVELVVGAPAGLYAELDDPAAIEKVYLGWFRLRSDTKEGWDDALGLFGDVAATHPDKPYGHSLTAFALWLGAANDWAADATAALDDALASARRATVLGDPSGLGRAVEAAVYMSLGRPDEALAALAEVEILRPTCDVTYGLEGSVLRYLGNWEEAVDLMDVAMRLTGINKPWYPTVKACSLFIGNRLDQAVSLAESVLEYQPTNLEALLVLAAAQSELGLDRLARATAQRVRDAHPAVDVGAWLDRSPYQDEGIVARWKDDLSAVGLVAAP